MRIPILLAAFILLISGSSCERLLIDRHPADGPVATFDSMWHTIDRKYSYFGLKEINWDMVYDTFRSKVNDEMDSRELFEVLADLLFTLRDGHVNLITSFDVSRNWTWYLNSPPNFDWNVIERNYLGEHYEITGALRNTWLPDTIGYIYYGSFMNNISDGAIDYVIRKFMNAKGIIIDVRNNGGGLILNADKLAGRFTRKRVLYGYERFKTGPGHDDFSDYYERYIEASGDTQYTGKVVVLTNRSSYSASNLFTLQMKSLPNVSIVGDTTGGGGGLPYYAQLPNGWTYRFSSTQLFDSQKRDVELGIAPDVYEFLRAGSLLSGRDDIIERARQIIKQ